MNHKFKINRSIEKSKYKEVDINIGESYLCISDYEGYSDERHSYHETVFTKGTYYKLLAANSDEAWFIQNDGTQYYIKSYMEGALFEYFDFTKTLTQYNRSIKIDEIIR